MTTILPYVLVVSLVVASISVLLIDQLRQVLERAPSSAVPGQEPAMRFLFERQKIVDLTPSAELLLSRHGAEGGTLKDVIDILAPRFADVTAAVARLDKTGHAELLASDGSAHLVISRTAEMLRFEVVPTDPSGQTLAVGEGELGALKSELRRLRGIADSLPYLVWREDAEGNINWVNQAYLDLSMDVFGTDPGTRWPLPQLFDLPPRAVQDGAYAARHWVGPEETGIPFEVSGTVCEDEVLFTAIPAESAVRAETSMRDVLQTLTKTFAQISIGLAVFGRDRRLVLFNPSLADLTGLRPETLAARPSLFEFLDLLRDRRTVPEPRNYKAWRSRLTDAAAAGRTGLSESWALPDGRTFQVTALPQNEGGTALMFEDITGQVVRNRSFRGTVELQQTLLDRRSEAIAVFSGDGTLTLCNDAYETLWNIDPSATMTPIRLGESLAHWKAATVPDPVWSGFPASAAAAGDPWQADVALPDGRVLHATAAALPGGNLLVEFHTPPEALHTDLPADRVKLLA